MKRLFLGLALILAGQCFAGAVGTADRAEHGGVRSATMTGNETWVAGDADKFAVLDPGGAGRTITLPAEANCQGLWFYIKNSADAAETLTIQEDAPSTIVSLTADQWCVICCDGTTWYLVAQGYDDTLAIADVDFASITGSDSSLGITGLAATAATGGAVVIKGGATTTSGVGGLVSLTGGAGAGGDLGGAASLAGGLGGATNAAGGVASVTGGAGQGTGAGAVAKIVGGQGGAGATGNGGEVQVTGGAAASTNGTGGAATITGGVGTGSGAGGGITSTGGAGAAAGTGDGGAVLYKGGASGTGATGAGGAATLQGGAAGSTNGAGGAVAVTGGAGVGSGNGGANTQLGGAGGATGGGGNWLATAGRGGATSGAAGTAGLIAGAGGASSTVSGGVATLKGGDSGAGATGNGGNAAVTGGAAASTNGSGGSVVLTPGALTGTGIAGGIFLRSSTSQFWKQQTAPGAGADQAEVLTAAQMIGGIYVHTISTGRTLTTPTGAAITAGCPAEIATGDSFEFTVITVGTGADDISTLTAGDGNVTFVGNVTVGPDASTFNGYGTWVFRKTGASTWVGYRKG